MAHCLLALGSNLGDRQQHLSTAVKQLGGHPTVDVVAVSRWHETLPMGGPGGQDPFLNGALLIRTQLSPEQLLRVTQSVEELSGRSREVKWGPRCIDLDLLIYDDLICRSEDLLIPHPWMVARRFVVEPAAEIAAQMEHPELGWTLDRLRQHLRQTPNRLAVIGSTGSDLVRRACQRVSATFIADPHDQSAAESRGPASVLDCQQQIELAEQRWQCLHDSNWSQRDAGAISAFWFVESVVMARSTLSAGDAERLEVRLSQWAAAIPTPKLLILCPATDRLAATTRPWFDWVGLSRYVRRQREFPWLELPVATDDRMIDQIAAAFESMQ